MRFAAINYLKVMRMEMISVKSRMPETEKVSDYNSSGKLLCLVNDIDYLILEYQFGDEDGGWTSWYCHEYEDSVENVTHWCKLPKLPTEEVDVIQEIIDQKVND
jgi:hypothetical protein